MKNRQKFGSGSAIALGSLLLQASQNLVLGDRATVGNLITRIGFSAGSAGFAAARYQMIKPETLDCGPPDLERVTRAYDILFRLDEVYDDDSWYSKPELQPESLFYHVVHFGTDARDALACLLQEGPLSRPLSLAIDRVVKTLSRITSNYEKMLQ